MTRLLVFSCIAAFCAVCWYLFFRWPVWYGAAVVGFALFSLVGNRALDWTARKRAERDWPRAKVK